MLLRRLLFIPLMIALASLTSCKLRVPPDDTDYTIRSKKPVKGMTVRTLYKDSFAH
jgi:hypothetical protein